MICQHYVFRRTKYNNIFVIPVEAVVPLGRMKQLALIRLYSG